MGGSVLTCLILHPCCVRLGEKPPFHEVSTVQIVQCIFERNRMMARTKRGRRSYGAGEWDRNRVRIFPERPFPDGVARNRTKVEPVAETPRVGAREVASGSNLPPGSSTRRTARWKPSPSRSRWESFLTLR